MSTSIRISSVAARLAAPLALAAALTACGISAQDRVTHIPADDLGALAQTTTTTTTTTTVPVTAPTVVPTSTPVETTSTTTTTLELIRYRPVNFYFVPRGQDEMVKRVPLDLLPDATVLDVLAFLSNPPAALASQNLTTEVRPGLVASYHMERLYTIVDLDPEVFGRMTDTDQRQAIAQLVLTLTNFVTPDRGSIAAIVFTVGGEEIAVPIPGGSVNPGEPVAFVDFEPWIDAATLTTTTTAPTTAPPTPPTTAPTPPSSQAA